MKSTPITFASGTQMKRLLSLSLFTVILIVSPGILLAQDNDSHPTLSDTFTSGNLAAPKSGQLLSSISAIARRVKLSSQRMLSGME